MSVSIKVLPIIKREAAKRLLNKLNTFSGCLKEKKYLKAERDGMKKF